ncbi:NADP-dependent oxidoreductase domain-containing protein [Syncephalis plumigaleata]|nr:NADP-dependent oxidoreductase domain-containing protein [Syncephalis plumigaleata]
MTTTRYYTLNNGVEIPAIGLGTYRMRDESALETAIRSALQAGYRMIDTASVYRNEEAIGRVLQRVFDDTDTFNELQRSDVFITSKLAPRDQGYEACLAAFETSCRKLNVDYIDLYLIHWPGTQKLKHDDPRNAKNREGSYRAMEKLYAEGKIRAIGVSNYTVRHLTSLLATATITPSVLQTELHPLWPDKALAAFCRKHQIQIEAYSSLGEGAFLDGRRTLAPVTQAVANSNGAITAAQVLLRWAVQHQYVVIPKSATPERIIENITGLFDEPLSDETMKAMDALSESEVNERFCWDPTEIA